MQISKIAVVSRAFINLKEDFGLHVDDITLSKAFLIFKSVSSKTFVRSFQLKLLDNTIFTSTGLAKIGYVPHNTCTFWEVESEMVCHLFYQCPLTYLFWKNWKGLKWCKEILNYFNAKLWKVCIYAWVWTI